MNEFELEYRIRRVEMEISCIVTILAQHGFTTIDGFKDMYESLRNTEDNKTVMDQLAYGVTVLKILDKGLLSEEDEKYIREANTWDTPEDIDKFITNFKRDTIMEKMFDKILGGDDE